MESELDVQEKGAEKEGLEIVGKQSFLGVKSANCFHSKTFFLRTREIAWSVSQLVPTASFPEVRDVLSTHLTPHQQAAASISHTFLFWKKNSELISFTNRPSLI